GPRGHVGRVRRAQAGVRAHLSCAAVTQTRARVLIVGSGLAGLACARRLAERRCADVVLLEQADSLGGTSRLSQGWIWTYRSEALRRRHAPDADPVAARLVASGWADAVA